MKKADNFDLIAKEVDRRMKCCKASRLAKDADGLVARDIHGYHYLGFLIKLPQRKCSPKRDRKFTLNAKRTIAQRFKK